MSFSRVFINLGPYFTITYRSLTSCGFARECDGKLKSRLGVIVFPVPFLGFRKGANSLTYHMVNLRDYEAVALSAIDASLLQLAAGQIHFELQGSADAGYYWW
ncbi:hypothetical protein JYU34_013307 [Plutella xylostella]|uniref:Uncharacterized protein n=1 Tax=Plutella xylostella TaxID=51655 RepID=A0ABQ7QAV5_PLUXY|nr:hypothetical protein JYU34_013307 [Plutella xylostella]